VLAFIARIVRKERKYARILYEVPSQERNEECHFHQDEEWQAGD
jgi:hypothetical protein